MLFTYTLSRRRLIGALTVGAMAGALPLGRAAAAAAVTAGPPRLPDQIRVRTADGGTDVVGVDDYLKGVVPAEMPYSWPVEALKAQAVAARTYVAAYVAQNGDVCSSASCQVWDPSKRHDRSDAAVDATHGELLTYQGGVIYAFYHSTCGGQTDGSALPYIKPVRCADGQPALDLSSEAAASAFWASDQRPAAFCSASPSYRWSWSSERDALSKVLDAVLGFVGGVAPRYQLGALGDLSELSVVQRGPSGKATKLHIADGDGSWNVTGDLSIRAVLRPKQAGPALKSANVVVALTGDGLTGRGGGAGHGQGMCQWGARGMALAGQDYRAILTRYFTGVELAKL